MFKIITKQDGTFGLQRFGSVEVHGSFSTRAEALEAAGMSQAADAAAYADPANY